MASDADGAVAPDATLHVEISQAVSCFCGERPLCVVSRAGPDVALRIGAAAPLLTCEACNPLSIPCTLPAIAPGRVGVRINDTLAGDLQIAAAPPGTPRSRSCRPINAATLEAPWHAAQIEGVAWALCHDSDDGHRRSSECLYATTSCRDGVQRAGAVPRLCMPDSLRCARIERDLTRIAAALAPAPAAASVMDTCPASSAGTDRRTLRTLRRGTSIGYACNDSDAAGDLARLQNELIEMCNASD